MPFTVVAPPVIRPWSGVTEVTTGTAVKVPAGRRVGSAAGGADQHHVSTWTISAMGDGEQVTLAGEGPELAIRLDLERDVDAAKADRCDSWARAVAGEATANDEDGGWRRSGQ